MKGSTEMIPSSPESEFVSTADIMTEATDNTPSGDVPVGMSQHIMLDKAGNDEYDDMYIKQESVALPMATNIMNGVVSASSIVSNAASWASSPQSIIPTMNGAVSTISLASNVMNT